MWRHTKAKVQCQTWFSIITTKADTSVGVMALVHTRHSTSSPTLTPSGIQAPSPCLEDLGCRRESAEAWDTSPPAAPGASRLMHLDDDGPAAAADRSDNCGTGEGWV